MADEIEPEAWYETPCDATYPEPDLRVVLPDLGTVLHDVWTRIHVIRFDDYRPDSFYAGVTRAERIVVEVAREHGIERVSDPRTPPGER